MLEKEVWGELSKDQFEEFLNLFGERFGKPSFHRRLSFSFWDSRRVDLNVRIRITDGDAEIMEKEGWQENSTEWNFRERKVSLPNDTDQILNAVKIFQNLFSTDDPMPVMQFENYLWHTDMVEIKLSHQFGTGDKYNFEVEILNDEGNLKMILKELGLADLVIATDVEFWEKWNEAVNLVGNKLSDEEIKILIEEYL